VLSTKQRDFPEISRFFAYKTPCISVFQRVSLLLPGISRTPGTPRSNNHTSLEVAFEWPSCSPKAG